MSVSRNLHYQLQIYSPFLLDRLRFAYLQTTHCVYDNHKLKTLVCFPVWNIPADLQGRRNSKTGTLHLQPVQFYKRDDGMHQNSKRQPFVLSWQEVAVGWGEMEAKHEGSPGDYMICNGHWPTKQGPGSQPLLSLSMATPQLS